MSGGGNVSVSDELEELKDEIGEDWAMEVENSCKAHCLQRFSVSCLQFAVF
jgi:hypothetical protein